MITMTVAIPMFNAGKIAWLALESLVRQENVDFEWELIIAEEQDKNKFGLEAVEEYRPLLERVNCRRIEYIKLEKWVPLPRKWKLMADKSIVSPSSEIFTFAGADNYNYKDRLKTEYDLIIKNGADWVSSLIMPFLFIKTGKVFVADYKKFEQNWKIHAGMAFSTPTKYANCLVDSTRRSGVDGWLFGVVRNYVVNNLKKKFIVSRVEGDFWKYGFGTHGLNNISGVSRYNILERTCNIDNSLKKLWPIEIMNKLDGLKDAAKL